MPPAARRARCARDLLGTHLCKCYSRAVTPKTRLIPPPPMTVSTLVAEVVEGANSGLQVSVDNELLNIGTADDNDLTVDDDAVSRYHLELAGTQEGIAVHDLGSTNGTYYRGARVRSAVVPIGARLKIGATTVVVRDGGRAAVELHSGELEDLVAVTPAMRRVMARIQRIAQSPAPSLLMGESGTGKEVAARAIHQLSSRAHRPFVTVDCGAFAPNLVASELFGHERGAFTGAHERHIGAFERADGGTIFLDEIGELPLELQPQLLGALERRRFRRLGGSKEIEVDVDVVSATNRDLRRAVNEGTFRLDLYYRLAVVTLRLPPLRERRDDIPVLVNHFLQVCGHDGAPEEVVSPEVMAKLRVHHWPGNVRELRNWVEATLAMGEAGELYDAGRTGTTASSASAVSLDVPYKEARAAVVGDFEHRYLSHLIEASRHNVSEAARRAKMDRSYLVKLLQRHGLR